VRMLLVGKTASAHARHPELVSGSIVPNKPPLAADKWTLKQVQGHDLGGLVVTIQLWCVSTDL
jgi:hypothetical protein